LTLSIDQQFMLRALELAQLGGDAGEVPVGAIVVRGTQIVGEGYNQPISTHDPTGHAEIVALRAAGHALGDYRLLGCTLYVTLEPCPMCAAAMVHARLERVVFGAWDSRQGAAGSAFNLLGTSGQNHRVDSFGGVLSAECGALLERFFRERRAP
jgi:tRNA(adenine34) deaminase